MSQSGTASAESVETIAIAGETKAPAQRETDRPLMPFMDAARVAAGVPFAVAALFLLAWASVGLAFAAVNTAPLPVLAGIAYGIAGLGIATTVAMVLERLLRRRATAAMRVAANAQRAFYQQAIDQLVDGFSVWDADDRLVIWNRQFADMMPRAASHLRRDMSYEELLQVWIDRGYAPRQAGKRWIQDCLERRWSGESANLRLVEDREFSFAERSGGDGVTALTVCDVTAQRARERALKDSEERYSLALIASNEALWDYDLRSEQCYLAPRAQAMLAATEGAAPISRADWTRHVHPDDVERQQDAWRRHLAGETDVYSVEYRLVDGGGVARWVYDCGLALRDSTGEAYRIAGSLGDISERKRTESALTAARDAAQLADRARTEFLSNITHELKTPLNVVIGFSDMLCQAGSDDLTAEQRLAYADEIRQAGSRLDRLVSDLLDLARAGSADTPLADSQVDLLRCLNRVVELVTDRAQMRQVAVEIDPASAVPPVIGDLGKLKHAVFSFIGHAVGRCDPGSTIRIHAGRESGQGIALRLEMSVCGVTDAHLRGVLQPLTPDANSSVQRADGVDLTLAVAESFVKLHDGTLELSILGTDRVMAVLRLPEERIV